MIRLVIILTILFIGLLFGHNLIEIDGRIIIALPNYMVELSLVSALIIAVFAVILFVILEWSIKKVFGSVSGSKRWFGNFSKRQQRKAFHQAIYAMVIGEKSTAKSHFEKVRDPGFQACNLLLKSELLKQEGEFVKAQAALIEAQEIEQAKPYAILKQAQLALMQKQPKEVLTLLSEVEGKLRQTLSFVDIKLHALAQLSEWDQVLVFAKEHKKVLGNKYVDWAKHAVKQEFAEIASKEGGKALKEYWQNLPRKAKQDEANQVMFVQSLIDQSMHEDAQTNLVAFASKHASEQHWELFKEIKLPNPSAAIKFVESEIKKSPTEANLYSILGHLAFNSGDFSLAQRAVAKSIELSPQAYDYKLYAKILEQNGDLKAANEVYKRLAV